MSPQRIVITQHFTQPVEQVFAALADHERLGEVFGAPVSRIREGQGSPNGVGSVRRIGPAPIGVQETVTTLEPNRRIVYRITRYGGPVRRHEGELLFAETADGCELTWTIQFHSLPLLGTVLAKGLERGIGRGLLRLARKGA